MGQDRGEHHRKNQLRDDINDPDPPGVYDGFKEKLIRKKAGLVGPADPVSGDFPKIIIT
jgi:hypothetical protein